MSDQVVTLTVKGVGDFSDVVNNVGSVQKALTKLKLPDKLGDNLNKNITAFYKEYEKYQQKIAGGLKTQGDYNQVEKSLNIMRNLYQAIGADAQKLLKLDMKDLLNLDTGELKTISNDITNIMKQIGNVKIDTAPFTKAIADIRGVTKNSKISGEDGLLNKILGNIKSGQIAEAKKALQELKNYADKVAPRETTSGGRMPGTLSVDKYNQLTSAIDVMNGAVARAEATMDPLIQKQNDLQRELEETKQKAASGIEKEFKGYNEASKDVERVTDSLKKMHQEEFNFNRQATDISRQIQQYFGLTQIIRKVGDIARDAFSTVKELDAAMTETAVVTNFDVGDMWSMLPTYTEQANQLGSTIKDVYEAATLYYQQGLNTNQAMGLANETLKMARIAGLDATEATNMMTAALRGFNMEVNQMSAQKINDIYSELAAITASDTKEIGSAMERTASIANAANMDFATTSAFLAQMIETTREAPENLGTAMKTIVARFQEMKEDPTKLIDSEGVAMDVNKVDTALKTIGVSLTNTKGEFRDLDDVFLDISAKWDSLTQGQQRYIATIAAGSRQQSRFIAMMSNYERTMELVDAANNSAGASQRQFEKTLDSMAAKLNMLKNAWDQFTMGLMNNQILKFGVDALTTGFTIINKFIDLLGKIPPKPFEGITKSLLTLVSTIGLLNLGGRGASAISGGVLGWLGGEGFSQGLSVGWSQPGKNNKNITKTADNKQVEQKGFQDGKTYALGFQKGQISINPDKRGVKGFLQNAGSAYKQIGQQAINWKQIQANKNNAVFQQVAQQILPPTQLTAEMQQILQKCIQEAEGNLEQGAIDFSHATGIRTNLDGITPELQEQYDKGIIKGSGKGIEKEGTKFDKFGKSVTNAGESLQTFGMILQGTPLAPFGQILSSVGSLLMGFGSTIGWVSAAWTAGIEAAGDATLVGTAKMQAGIRGVTTALMESPVFWVVAAILAVVAAVKLADLAFESQAEKLEKAEDAAASASEAYDSAKQETSELADAISKIQETDAAFDNLVAGTAEFNEQLVTANDQIMALIDKYPMLLDANKNYVTTDDNGLMHISEAGFKAVKEYQKQIQANASAMNLIQTADLNALEHQQEADALRKKINGSRRGEMTEAEAKEHEKNLREADMLDQQAEAETKLARSNAIRTALAGKEIRDIDSLTSVYTNLYNAKRKAAEVDVNKMGKHDIRQQYADYHGYTYDRSTKKITDVEGNEVDYDDNIIKDEVVEQTVLLDFEANAKTLESVLNQVDAKFADSLESTSESSSHFISDVLANNINTDENILEKALSNNDFQDAVNSMTEKEMAAILGINAEAINEQNIDAKRDEIVDLLTENATNIAEAQSKSYEDLATMMAQSKGWDTFDAEQKASQDLIRKEIRDLTSEQAHMMSNIGSQLKQGAGMEAMQLYINRMSKLYSDINKQDGATADKDAAKEIEDIFNSVDLTSAAGRLEAYTKMAESASDTVKNLGEDMRTSADEANLLGTAFDEFLGGEWLELSENADDFKNSLGQIDAAGILKASEQSHTLKTMLDSGEVSASGLAMALQGVEDGKFSIGAVNESVLQLLSSLHRVEDEAMRAHNLIENFDAGVDYGEASDFAKENAEKAQEYWDSGQYGNPQLQNYIKLAAGEERWNDALKASGGDFEKAEEQLIKYVTTFKDGFQPVIDQLVSGKGIDGDSLNKNIEEAVKKGTLDETLAEKFKTAAPRIENGDFIFGPEGSKTTDFTTEELKTYLEQVYGVSTEYAQLILEEWANLSPDLAAELSKNDLMAAVQTDSFKESHGTTASGQTILTDQEIGVIEQAGGEEALEKVATDLGYAATEQKSAAEVMKDASFKVLDENGNRIDNAGDPSLLQSYIKTFGMAEKGSIESLIKTGSTELFTGGKLDLSKLIQDTQAHGFDQQQAMQAAWQTYQRNEQLYKKGETNTAVSYEGVDLEHGIATYEDFTASIESALEASKWQSIGESIAQGIINFIKGNDPGEPKESTGMTQEEANAKSAQESRDIQQDIANKQGEAIVGFFNKISDFVDNTRPSVDNDPKTNSGLRSSGAKSTDESTNLEGAGDSLTNAATEFTTAISTLATAATTLSTAATTLSIAANKLSQNNIGNNNPTPSVPVKQYAPGAPSNIPPNQSLNQQGTIEVDNSDANSKLNETKELAIDTKNTIDQGAKFTITTPGASSLNKAAKSAQKITDNSGSKSISVTASGTEDANNLTSAVKKFNSLNGHSVKLKAKLSGATPSEINSIIKSIDAFHKKTDHTVTLKTINKKEATGNHNHGYVSAPPKAGSVARGSYGQLGPKGKGGMTLTGELGYEIAWIPSENRSMILGANGPQMINLPGDTVVWTHEQSKKIMSQKSIPAGSHFRISQNSMSSSGGNNNASASKQFVDNAKKVGDDLSKKAQNTSEAITRVTVWWENAARRADSIQRKIDANQDEYQKYLKKLSATLHETGENGGNAFISENRKYIAEQELQYNKATNELGSMTTSAAKSKKGRKKQYKKGADNVIQVSYEGKKNKKGKAKTKTAYVDTSKYLTIDPDSGAYQINQQALKKIGNKKKRKAVADQLNKELNDRLAKQKAAEENIRKAQEAYEKFSEELYNTFFAWENELTKIWNITQKIEAILDRISRGDSMDSLLKAQIHSGLGDTNGYREQMVSNFSSRVESQQEAIRQRRQAIDQSRIDLATKVAGQDVSQILAKVDEKLRGSLSENDRAGYQKYREELVEQQKVRTTANKYLTTETNASDGTIKINFDSAKFEEDRLAGLITSDMGKSIQDLVKELQDDSKNLNNLYKEQTEALTELYDTLDDLNKEQADMAAELLDINEEANKKEIEELQKLNDSIKQAMDDLLNEVKHKLDERRKLEENSKTERDISQKQQRLAMLRADTSGGHTVEIAQLEKEIQEAQSSYQQSLEDQLLDKLQNQADEASKQRERQIKLQEETLSSVNNIAKVQEWMAAPEGFKDQIYERWREAKKYDQLTDVQQAEEDRNFLTNYSNLLSNGAKRGNVVKAIADNTVEEARRKEEDELKLTNNEAAVKWEQVRNKLYADFEKITPENWRQVEESFNVTNTGWNNLTDAQRALTNFDKKDEILKGIKDNKIINFEQIIKQTESELEQLDNQQLLINQQLEAANSELNRAFQNVDAARAAYDAQLQAANQARARGILIQPSNKYVLAAEAQVEQVQQRMQQLSAQLDKVWASRAQKQQLIEQTQEQLKVLKYKKGGIADFTGPAWLDGTPSKPELVLNATDTKNFIALKDVLSRAMSSVGHVENSYGGNANFEININVDHISNDYDVNKVVDQVEKRIVQKSGYRNVTQVRNFR